jgi:amino acid transporter
VSKNDSTATPRLKRALGFRDLLLFYVVTVFSLRWIATAATIGPSALVVWVIAAVGLFLPLVFTVLELSARYPDEGGIYVWAKVAFGPLAGFMSAWTYWTANLPYFPGLLYFAAGNLLFVGGAGWQSLSTNSTYFIVFSLLALAGALVMNIVGLDVLKWLSNAGALAGWIPVFAVIVLGMVHWAQHGSAVPLAPAAFVPHASIKDMVFWSTIAFAFGGVEGASTMAEEIEDAERTIPRAVIASAVIITALYMIATLAILVAIPASEVSGLQGMMQALQVMGRQSALAWLVPLMAVFVTLNALGGVGGWFAATSRLPFVAGIDRFLPQAFARVHPRWRTPHVALLTQAAIAAVFVFIGQAGTSVHGAYDVLVSMSIVTYFIPFLFMFAAMIRVQRTPPPAGIVRAPGGARMGVALGALGLFTTAVSIVLACVPAPDEANKPLAVAKIVGSSVLLVAIGLAVYAAGRRSQRIERAA